MYLLAKLATSNKPFEIKIYLYRFVYLAGGMPQMVLEYVLHLHGIVPGEDVEIITNLAFTTTAGAFVGGIGDFTAEFDPAAREIELTGHGEVVAGLADFVDAIP